MAPYVSTLAVLLLFIIPTIFGQLISVFNGVWSFTFDDRSFKAYICAEDEDAVYFSIVEVLPDDSEYTISVAFFDKITESDTKAILAGSDCYILSKRDDSNTGKNKNGYFKTVLVVRYEKPDDEMFIHFKLNRRDRPGNSVMKKLEGDEGWNKWSCWVPPFDYEYEQIPNEYPQVWRSGMIENERDNHLIITKKREKEMCWGWTDAEGEVLTKNGGYFTAIEQGYDGKLIWFDVGTQYGTHDDCRSGSGFMMVIGQKREKWMAQYSWLCNDGKTGRQVEVELHQSFAVEPKYKCPMVVAGKTDL